MFKWIAKLVLKPVIKPVKKAIELCDKLIDSIDKLVVTVNGLPLDQSYKNEIIETLTTTKNAIGTVSSVLIKVLKCIDEKIPYEKNPNSIAKIIDDIKLSL